MTIDGFDELLDGIEQIKRAILSLVTAEDTNSGVTKVEIVRDIPRMVPQPVTHVNIKAVSKDDGVTPVNLVADPATGHLQVDSTGGGGGGGGGSTNNGATVFWAQASLAGTGSTAVPTQTNTRWWVEVVIPLTATITGIAFQKLLSDEITKVIVELHDTSGTVLAHSDLSGTVVNNVDDFQKVAFTATASVTPGRYFAAFMFNDTGVNMGVMNGSPVAGESAAFVSGFAAGTFGTTANFTPGTTCYAPTAVVCSTY